MQYADVIVPLAVEGMFTYALPASLEGKVGVGMLVLVPFAGNKIYTALVCRIHDRKPEGYEVKEVEALAEEQVFFSQTHLAFLLWVADYYMAAPGEVMKAALPVAFRLESFTAVARKETDVDEATLSPNEKVLLSFLRVNEYVSLKEVGKHLRIKNVLALVKPLLTKGYVAVKETVDDFFRERTELYVMWNDSFSDKELDDLLDLLKRAPLQHRLLCCWIDCREERIKRRELLEIAGVSPAILKALCDKGILKVEERKATSLEEHIGDGQRLHSLSDEQTQALMAIRENFSMKDCVLLKGVTSSGKTEVYIHLIQEYLAQGKQVLYLLPEIALTLQIVRRLQQVFGEGIGIYHSGMSDRMRAELWRKQCSAQPYHLILGVRSAVFLPFSRLGLVIVDEEHDASYKQKDPAPRYHGRDVAIMLGKMHGARVLLGSATPSFESWHHALSGKYGRVELNSRYGGVMLPEIVMADLGKYRRTKRMQGSFTPLLLEEMRKVLAEGKQVILFQNRRGYSSYVQCDTCGNIPKCRHCDVSLTYHKQRNILVCHYCGALVPMTVACSECGTGHYCERTPGTERIEEEVKALFPEQRVARMDVDVLGSKARFRAVMEDFEQGRIDILIGTQMVTKGLDFGSVKLVGVMNADAMVNFPDFRAEERAYCMLMQVSGRSGRRGERGKVVIQAADFKNRLYVMLLEGDYMAFFNLLMAERRIFGYPPFGRMIQIELRSKEVAELRDAANWLAEHLRERLGRRVCGPAVPEVGRIGGWYRIVVLVKIEVGTSVSAVKTYLRENFALMRQYKKWGRVRFFCDVDP